MNLHSPSALRTPQRNVDCPFRGDGLELFDGEFVSFDGSLEDDEGVFVDFGFVGCGPHFGFDFLELRLGGKGLLGRGVIAIW